MSTAHSQEAIIGYTIDTEAVRYPDDADLLRNAKETLSNHLFDLLVNPQIPAFVTVEDGQFYLKDKKIVPAGLQASLSVFKDSKTILNFFRVSFEPRLARLSVEIEFRLDFANRRNVNVRVSSSAEACDRGHYKRKSAVIATTRDVGH